MPGINRLYIGAGRRSTHIGSSGTVLGPNLLANTNGSYLSGGWVATQVTETAGQTDPLSGTTARLMADTAVSSVHQALQSYSSVSGQKYLVTAYLKLGTLTAADTVSVAGDIATTAVDVNLNTGTQFSTTGSPTNVSVSSVANGFVKLTYNFLGATTGAVNFGIAFGPFATYVGSGQNMTWWGLSVQTST